MNQPGLSIASEQQKIQSENEGFWQTVSNSVCIMLSGLEISLLPLQPISVGCHQHRGIPPAPWNAPGTLLTLRRCTHGKVPAPQPPSQSPHPSGGLPWPLKQPHMLSPFVDPSVRITSLTRQITATFQLETMLEPQHGIVLKADYTSRAVCLA